MIQNLKPEICKHQGLIIGNIVPVIDETHSENQFKDVMNLRRVFASCRIVYCIIFNITSTKSKLIR